MAIFVLGHECGHRAFSPSRLVNDTVGMILHSAILVPFHPWRITHGNHHKHTNHLDLDTAFVPPKRESALKEALETSPLYTWGLFFVATFTGWWGYLVFNIASQDYGRRTNHFEPSSPLFRPSDAIDVIVSDIALLGMFGIMGAGVFTYGFANMLLYVFVPYIVGNGWLVYITFMHHADIRVPKYDAKNWNYVRGALATIDRRYGWILDEWMHNITDSHVVHHLFSTVPHYNAIEITRKYIKDLVGEFYAYDDRSLYTTTVESWGSCNYVVPTEGVAYFHK
jgi:omega-6 fatty acid desaturase (delta-12 desaturase)